MSNSQQFLVHANERYNCLGQRPPGLGTEIDRALIAHEHVTKPQGTASLPNFQFEPDHAGVNGRTYDKATLGKIITQLLGKEKNSQ